MRPVKMLSIVAVSGAMLAGLPAGAGAAEPLPGVVKTTLTETNLVTMNGADPAYRSLLARRASNNLVASDGAAERNIAQYLDVAFQRSALWLLERGIAEPRESYVDQAVRAIEYGFRKQAKDGSFTNTLGLSATDDLEGASFFLQSFGRAYDMIANTSYRGRYLSRLDALKGRVATSMVWLAGNLATLQKQSHNAPNRMFFHAVSFILNGKILIDAKSIQVGSDFVQRGLKGQRSDGSFIEGGGYDSSYQGTCLQMLVVLLPHIDNPTLKAAGASAVQKGLAWEKTRIRPTGEVIVDGNARTGLGQEELLGKPKDVNYAEVAVAMIFGGEVVNDPQATQLGRQIATYAVQPRKN